MKPVDSEKAEVNVLWDLRVITDTVLYTVCVIAFTSLCLTRLHCDSVKCCLGKNKNKLVSSRLVYDEGRPLETSAFLTFRECDLGETLF